MLPPAPAPKAQPVIGVALLVPDIGSSTAEAARVVQDTLDYKKVAALRFNYAVKIVEGDRKHRLEPTRLMPRRRNREGMSPNPGHCETFLLD